ncbi:MAG: DNA-binding transcriptional regulator FrlR [Lentisphaerae bacterium ADurb.Bin242]|nr:MAG: DNA-binding transcriptional regulator FrlR [Lentisphaerae bacterium ADurb.Bin242]
MNKRILNDLETEQADRVCNHIVQDITEKISRGILCPGMKLLSERKLCDFYNTDAYNIRKAIQQLKKTGHLHSVPKFGVFISETALSSKLYSARGSIAPDIHIDKLRFETLSNLSLQKKVWNLCCKSFKDVIASGDVEMVYRNDRVILEEGDVIEYGSLYQNYYLHQNKLLRLRECFPGISPEIEKFSYGNALPFYYAVPVLLYNIDLLNKLGFRKPDYKNYAEQMKFCGEVTTATARTPGMQLPQTAQIPMLYLGNLLQEFLVELHSGNVSEKTFARKYRNSLQEFTLFWVRNQISFRWGLLENYFNFIAGKMPLFFSLSTDYIFLNDRCPPFAYGCSSMFAIDESAPRIYSLLSINSETLSPIESLRLILLMREQNIQRALGAIGNFPIRNEDRCDMPQNFDDLSGKAKESFFIFENHDHYYVSMNIINKELLNMIQNHKSADSALHDIYRYSRVYFHMAEINRNQKKSGERK